MQQQPPADLYPPRPTNGLAVLSLVTGILAYFLLPVVGAVVAVITGHIARTAIRRTGEGGGGMAVAGLVLGYIQVAPIGFIVAVLVLSMCGSVEHHLTGH